MKIRICAAFLSMLLAISLLAGCESQPAPTENQALRATEATRRQLFQVDITADAPELGDVILEESVPLAVAPAAEIRLTEEDAVSIALDKAGLRRELVTQLEVEFEIDDGVAGYEVSFCYDGWEYDYEIHADSGSVLKAEKSPQAD